MKISKLKQTSWECIHFVSDNPVELIGKELNDSDIQLFVIKKDSSRMDQELLSAISDAMQFPDYFGKNWDALDECLTDLNWLPESKGYILVISHSKEIWRQNPYCAGKLVQSWLNAAYEWSKDEISFHLIFADCE